MKKFFMLCGMVVLGFASQSFAATIELGEITDGQIYSKTVASDFEVDSLSFRVSDDIKSVVVSISNIGMKLANGSFFGVIDDMKVSLDGLDLALNDASSDSIVAKFFLGAADLSKSIHTLMVSGKSAGTYIVGFTASPEAISDVPVPAAVWLFGSALVALVTVKRGKN